MLSVCICLPFLLVKLRLLHLGWHRKAVAWPYGADSCLSLQLALGILVGNTRGNAHPTAAGALGPIGDLDWTFPLLQVVPHCDWGAGRKTKIRGSQDESEESRDAK